MVAVGLAVIEPEHLRPPMLGNRRFLHGHQADEAVIGEDTSAGDEAARIVDQGLR